MIEVKVEVNKEKKYNFHAQNRLMSTWKRYLLIVICCNFRFICAAQYYNHTEDGIYQSFSRAAADNRMTTTGIGKPEQISLLRFRIDSLNKEFANYKRGKKYWSLTQGIGNTVRISKGDIIAAKNDIDSGIAFKDFCKKYPQSDVSYNDLMVERKSEGKILIYKAGRKGWAKNIIEFNDHTVYKSQHKGKWIYDFNLDYDYFVAVYFPNGLKSKEMPAKYARMIRYNDFMMDTARSIFLENVQLSSNWFTSNSTEKVRKFLNYINQKTDRPDITKVKLDHRLVFECPDFDSCYRYYLFLFGMDTLLHYSNAKVPDDIFAFKKKRDSVLAYKNWFSNRYRIIDSTMVQTPEFRKLFGDAIDEALTIGYTNEQMEDYAEKYASNNVALTLKRGRYMPGNSCGTSFNPQFHIYDIARLAALKGDVKLFLHSYLVLIGSPISEGYTFYPSGYSDELTLAGIDVLPCLLGMSLTVLNPSQESRYWDVFGTANFTEYIPRSIKEKVFIHYMSQIISDNTLDDYNRVTLFNSMIHYVRFTRHKHKKQVSILKKMRKTLPSYLRKGLDIPALICDPY
jgi:hypothetical protein